ncbi:hypothetical protein BDZ45DRAFT_749159 [Acephala macrosclerotiorum]|nr:hypothetical protein BDZ45DRAFT_749159 [Acephala macrosclerotiorum]
MRKGYRTRVPIKADKTYSVELAATNLKLVRKTLNRIANGGSFFYKDNIFDFSSFNDMVYFLEDVTSVGKLPGGMTSPAAPGPQSQQLNLLGLPQEILLEICSLACKYIADIRPFDDEADLDVEPAWSTESDFTTEYQLNDEPALSNEPEFCDAVPAAFTAFSLSATCRAIHEIVENDNLFYKFLTVDISLIAQCFRVDDNEAFEKLSTLLGIRRLRLTYDDDIKTKFLTSVLQTRETDVTLANWKAMGSEITSLENKLNEVVTRSARFPPSPSELDHLFSQSSIVEGGTTTFPTILSSAPPSAVRNKFYQIDNSTIWGDSGLNVWSPNNNDPPYEDKPSYDYPPHVCSFRHCPCKRTIHVPLLDAQRKTAVVSSPKHNSSCHYLWASNYSFFGSSISSRWSAAFSAGPYDILMPICALARKHSSPFEPQRWLPDRTEFTHYAPVTTMHNGYQPHGSARDENGHLPEALTVVDLKKTCEIIFNIIDKANCSTGSTSSNLPSIHVADNLSPTSTSSTITSKSGPCSEYFMRYLFWPFPGYQKLMSLRGLKVLILTSHEEDHYNMLHEVLRGRQMPIVHASEDALRFEISELEEYLNVMVTLPQERDPPRLELN